MHRILGATTRTTSKGDDDEWDYNCYITNMKPQPRLLKTFQLNEGNKEGTQDERERLSRPLKLLETKEGTQDDREIIMATKMVRNQRGNPR